VHQGSQEETAQGEEMQTVLMLIQFGTLVLVSVGAWISLKKPGRTDAEQSPAKEKDVKVSMS